LGYTLTVILKKESNATHMQDFQDASLGFVNKSSSDLSLPRTVQWNNCVCGTENTFLQNIGHKVIETL